MDLLSCAADSWWHWAISIYLIVLVCWKLDREYKRGVRNGRQLGEIDERVRQYKMREARRPRRGKIADA